MSDFDYSDRSDSDLIARVFKVAAAIVGAIALIGVPMYLIATWQWSEYQAQKQAQQVAYSAEQCAKANADIDSFNRYHMAKAKAMSGMSLREPSN